MNYTSQGSYIGNIRQIYMDSLIDKEAKRDNIRIRVSRR